MSRVLRGVVSTQLCDEIRTQLEPLLSDLVPYGFPGRTIAPASELYGKIEGALRPLIPFSVHPADSITGMKYIIGSLLQGDLNCHIDKPVERKYWDTSEVAITLSLGLGGAGCSIVTEVIPRETPTEELMALAPKPRQHDLAKGDVLLIPGGTPHRVNAVEDVPLYRVTAFFCKDKSLTWVTP